MKLCLAAMILIASPSALAADAIASLDASVYLDTEMAADVRVSAPIGNDIHVLLGTGQRLEMVSKESETIVTLLDSSGSELHVSRTLGSPSMRPSVAYLFCGAAVTHLSPRPDPMPSCSELRQEMNGLAAR